MNGLVPEKRRDRNGVLRTVYVRPGKANRTAAALPAPTTAGSRKPSPQPTAKPERVGPDELARARRDMLSKISEVDDRFTGRTAVGAAFAHCLQRLARLEPGAFRALGDRLAVGTPYEVSLQRDVLLRALETGTEQTDEAFAASIRLNVLVATTVAALNPDESMFAGSTIRANQLRNLLANSTKGLIPRPGAEAIRAILLANWARGFNSASRPLNPDVHAADLRFIEEHLDTLMARRDFIAARLPGFEKAFGEAMAVLRLAAEGSPSDALLEGAL